MPAQATTAPATQPAPRVVQPPAKAQFHVYLLMGQSNMAGRDTRDLDAQVDDARVLALDVQGPHGRWVVARDPIHGKIGHIDPGVGPGIAFATAMVKQRRSITIGLVPCAVGGSPFDVKPLYRATAPQAHRSRPC